MPNWCDNIMHIVGKKENVKEFLSKHIDKNDTINFNTIIPMPTTEEECKEKYGTKFINHHKYKIYTPIDDMDWFDWYSWCNMYWDTKWNAHDGTVCIQDLDNDLCNVELWFETAWSAPTTITFKLQEMYKNKLEIRHVWYEPGMNNLGSIETNGEYFQYDFDEDGTREFSIREGFLDEEYWKGYDEEQKILHKYNMYCEFNSNPKNYNEWYHTEYKDEEPDQEEIPELLTGGNDGK